MDTKDWFEHESGYVNIDSTSIYFTNTGNWSETKELNEKAIQKPNTFRIFRMYLSIVVLVLVVAISIVYKLLSFERNPIFSTIAIAILLSSSYALYRSFKKETGSKFKLPISKIKTVELIDKKTVVIHFYNGINEEDELALYGVSEKGLSLLHDFIPSHGRNLKET